MSAHKHTPGPWYIGPEFGANQMRPSIRIYRDVIYVDGCSPTTYVIGEVGYPTTTGNTVGAEERRANARLIAAAPELLEALKNLRDAEWMVTHEWGGDRKAALDAADAAIAKATGEPA